MIRLKSFLGAMLLACCAAAAHGFTEVTELEVMTPQPVAAPALAIRMMALSYDQLALLDARVQDDRIQVVIGSQSTAPLPVPPHSVQRRVEVLIHNVPPSAMHIDVYGSPATHEAGFYHPDSLLASVPVEIAAGPFPMTQDHLSIWPPDPRLDTAELLLLDRIWVLIEPPNACQGLEVVTQNPRQAIEVHETAPDCDAYPAPVKVAVPTRANSPSPGEYGRYASVWIRYVPFEGETVDYQAVIPLNTEGLSPRISGSWYDPEQSGQGINLEVLSDGRVLLYWYTFDGSGEPVWIVAGGERVQGGAVLEAYTTTGGAFPPLLNPDEVVREDWGQIELEFFTCETGHMTWITNRPGFTSGAKPLVRLSGPHGATCKLPPPAAERAPQWFTSALLVAVLPGS